MNPTLDVWCTFCDHAQAFALMALVPVLLYTWHTERADAATTDTVPAVDELAPVIVLPLPVPADDERTAA